MSQENKDVNIQNIAMDYRINTMHGDGVIEKVKNIPFEVKSEDLKERIDLGDKKIFTIDESDTRDSDDAISLESVDEGNRSKSR